MGLITDDLDALYDEAAFGASVLTFGAATAAGYFDQEETLGNDGSGDALLVKRTVFRMQTPKSSSGMASLAADSSVTVYDPESDVTTSYVVSDTELVGDGKETRVILRTA